ncbi:MAG: aspartate aminotransferase family protein [Mariprofundaceae bacterium]|nr:aspartate aminotransferase family protein [Mariprofundaceae bacterium]
MTNSAIMNTYARYPLTLVRGRGCRVQDDSGNEYLDFISGIAVNTLGHAHPAIQQAITEQAKEILHCSNLFHIPAQEALAKRLAGLSGLSKVFFCNSGAEANEAAIKLARRYFYLKGSTRRTVITAKQSFHGRLLSTLAATGQEKVKIGFDPLPTGFHHVALNAYIELDQAIDEHTAAIMLEPIQGEGGIHVASHNYLQMVRALCDEHGILFILDEVQTGVGRCGTMFAHEQAGIKPDVLTLGKGLGGGMPIACMIANEATENTLSPGTHGSTFGGNPMVCRAALAVLDVIESENLLHNVHVQGAYFSHGLTAIAEAHDEFLDVRGQGLLLGLGSTVAVAAFISQCRDDGLLVLPAGSHVVRFLPPLNVTEADIDEALMIIKQAAIKVFS